jgi:glycosyltransferase involved in cell wall biosynthesis
VRHGSHQTRAEEDVGLTVLLLPQIDGGIIRLNGCECYGLAFPDRLAGAIWAMIEAMACGTPVIAFRRGSAPEVIDDRSSSLIRADLLKREPILRP